MKGQELFQSLPDTVRQGATNAVFGLYGAGGFGREVMPILKSGALLGSLKQWSSSNEIFFVEEIPSRKEVNGFKVFSRDEFFKFKDIDKYFNVAIADSKIRERIAKECISKGGIPASVISENSIYYDNSDFGEGAIICANTMITSNVKIGNFFHLNIYSYVAHDCVIGDYVTFAPAVRCNGNVRIEDHVYIGTGAVIKPGSKSKPLVIGTGAVVGMGAVVTKDVAPGVTVVGNPARPIHTN